MMIEDQANLDKMEQDDVAAAGSDVPPGHNLVVRLKLPKSDKPTESAGTKEDADEIIEKKHHCYKCNKGFLSGKAFGGHMSSAHVQANKASSSKKKLKSKIRGCKSDHFCNFCGKDFSSSTSLYGHMGSCPDMPSKDAEPRISDSDDFKGGFDSSDRDVYEEDDDDEYYLQSDDAVNEKGPDLRKFLKIEGWSAKDKRGRRSLKPTDKEDSNAKKESSKEVMAAVDNLMAYLKDAQNWEIAKVSDFNEEINNGSGSHVSELDSVPREKGSLESGESASPLQKTNENVEIKNLVDSVKGKRVKRANNPRPYKKQKMDGDASSSKAVGEFVCTVCGMKFTTHQALGGHMSSHKKVGRITIFNTADQPGNKFGLKNKGVSIKSNESTLVDDVNDAFPFKCGSCGKGFSSGQALGGHKRTHCTTDNQRTHCTIDNRRTTHCTTDNQKVVASSSQSVPVHNGSTEIEQRSVPRTTLDLNMTPGVLDEDKLELSLGYSIGS